MVSVHRSIHRVAAFIAALTLLFSSVAPIANAQTGGSIFLPLITGGNASTGQALLFRTRVTVRTPAQWRDLTRQNVVVLTKGDDWAQLLVDDEQLADLARLRYNPTVTDALDTLAAHTAAVHASFADLLGYEKVTSDQLSGVSAQSLISGAQSPVSVRQSLRTQLRTALHALSAAQLTTLTQAASVDSDNDGLTDDQEGFWCTDPGKADSDGDHVSDGDEVKALKAWMNNERSGPPSSGKPFLGWPPQKQNCFDDDRDSVPDAAETDELGLNPSRESTDGDKFDDGEELFGVTNCPGGDTNCGYGDLPRSSDSGYVGSTMPAWVKAPGNHPLVAAFPVPGIDVVESSFHVQTVTTVTTDHTISSGTEKSYSTAKTEGTSSSTAETTSWNDWQETSRTTPELNNLSRELDPQFFGLKASSTNGNYFGLKVTGATLGLAGAVGGALCVASAGIGCAILAGAGIVGAGIALGATLLDQMDDLQAQAQANRCDPNAPYLLPKCVKQFIPQSSDAQPSVSEQAQTINTQDLAKGESGSQYTIKATNQVVVQPAIQISYPPQHPTTTKTIGHSEGQSLTTTHTNYEEHTVTNGEAFSNGESWGNATAVDSAHAADLWFTYKVRNTGMEYAREIGNLAFNVYIGDDPNPAYTYFVAPDLGGDGKFHNFMPTEEHQYTSRHIPLTLEQMKAIDLGGPLRIVVEDFSYGADELFYQNAANAGVQVAIEDGTDDGAENIDTYLIPTWGSETVLNVLARYFPHETDTNGTVTAIWTPEYRSDTPSWCQSPRRPTDQPSKAVWCKHVLSTAEWWNVYTNGLGDGSEGFQDTPAAPGSVALFRFNKDTDLDGFSDRSEVKLGTDPNDAASFPHPELLAGVNNIRNGNQVVSTLSLLNTGFYDAYGVEAIMVAPDDSVSITNNTVGGSGRVRALKQVIVGSRLAVQSPLPAAWTQANHAVPATGGYYTGAQDRAYTFSVNCPNPSGCKVGEGTWTVGWNDGQGNSGSLNFGAGYNSPTFLPVGALGVTLALYSGNVANGESFTVVATTPRDTFQYTVNREPHTEPLVIVSYNDPQGNHRFVVPPAAMNLSDPTADLHQFAGQMLPNVGVELVTSTPFAAGSNSVNLLVNNPSDKTLTNAHLFLEAINISGTVVAEIPTQVTLPPGPKANVVPFNTNSFNPPYNAGQDYIIMAFLTDYQGNILDTAGRPLSSFQADPLPKLAADDASLTWNFGSVAQGTLLKHALALANTGFGQLYTYVPPASGLSLSSGGKTIGAADLLASELTLRTAALPIGPYDQTITIATSDPTAPARTLHVLGTITAPSGDTPGGAVPPPLDVPVTVTGSHSQGEWFDFSHTLGPDSQSLHPVKVYNQDYGTFFGVGKYATNFGQGTASYDMFGDGSDGDLVVNSGQTVQLNLTHVNVNASGTNATPVNSTGFAVGDLVLFHQTQGTANVGRWEFATIAAINSATSWILTKPLQYLYDNTNGVAQVIKVPQYGNVTVKTGGILEVAGWDGSNGGVSAFRAIGATVVESGGQITAIGKGFRGGYLAGANNTGQQGEGLMGYGTRSTRRNNNGGGGGEGGNNSGAGEPGSGGGGGGHAAQGANGWSNSLHTQGGQGGDAAGQENFEVMVFGGGGGQGGGEKGATGSAGGNGGGIIVIGSKNILIQGSIDVGGNNGSDSTYPGNSGAGGAGGGIKLQAEQISLLGQVRANGGVHGTMNANPGWGESEDGSNGRIRIEYCESLTGTTNPPASTQKLNCYIAEQVETTPYTNARLNLPEAVNGSRTYNVQFGRKLDFAATGNQITQLRVPAGMLSSAKVDLLASGLAADTAISLDIGDDGAVDWSGTVANNSTTTSPELAQAFNAYWASHGAAATGTLDIPLRVTSSGTAQLLLTNLQLQSAASSLRSVRLTAQNYTKFLLDFTAGTSGSVVAALDIGDNGSIDWSSPAAGTAPMRWQTGDLKTALNSYLTGKSSVVDVPIRFYVSPPGAVKLNDYTATAAAQTDLVADSITVGNVVQTASLHYNEGDTVPVQATLRNSGATDSGPVTAAFFANAPGWGDWYIGSALLTNIPAGGSAPVNVQWNTTGFGSDKPVAVKVVVNPYGRLNETNVANNSKTVNATVTPTQVEQTITFAAVVDKLLTDAPFTLQATASSGLAVVFASQTPPICTVNGSTVTLVSVGICTILATQTGNPFYKAAPAVERSFVVNDPGKANQIITFGPLVGKTLGDAPFTVNVTASSGLAVSLASLTPSVCTASGNTVTLLAAGVCTLRATQAGDATHNPAAPVDQSFTVAPPATKQDQTMIFGPLSDKTLGDAPFTVNATASSGLPVSFTAAPPEVCTVNGNTVALVAAGECSLTASQAGDATFNVAPAVTQKFLVHAQSSQSGVFLPLVRR